MAMSDWLGMVNRVFWRSDPTKNLRGVGPRQKGVGCEETPDTGAWAHLVCLLASIYAAMSVQIAINSS